MNRSRRKFLLQLRGALLLSAAALAVAAPLPGGYAAFAEDDSHDGGSSGGSGGSSGGVGGGSGGSEGGGSGSGGSEGGGSGGGEGGGSGGGEGGGSGGGEGGGSGGGEGVGSGSGEGGGNSGSGGSGSGTSVSPSQEDGSAASQTRDGALATSLKGQIAPIGEIEALTGRTVPGEIIDIKLYQDKAQYVYRVKVMRWDGTIYDVKIDAMNRKLISARPR